MSSVNMLIKKKKKKNIPGMSVWILKFIQNKIIFLSQSVCLSHIGCLCITTSNLSQSIPLHSVKGEFFFFFTLVPNFPMDLGV